jgi:hypothetical protein
MGAEALPSCANCQRLQAQLEAQRARLEAQQAQLEAQQARLDDLQRTVSKLEAQLATARKDSSTSSKPPSSDIVKPPKAPPPPGQDRRRIGGQPGHPKHERALFPPEEVTGGSHDHYIELCPSCGQGLQPTAAAPRVVQQIEIREVPLQIEEHCSHAGWCPHCREVRHAPLPLTIGCGSRSRGDVLCTEMSAHRHHGRRLSIGLPSHVPLTLIHPAHEVHHARVVDGSTSVRPSGLPGSHEPCT